MRPPSNDLLFLIHSPPTPEGFAQVAMLGLAKLRERLGKGVLLTCMESGLIEINPDNPKFMAALQAAIQETLPKPRTFFLVRWGEGMDEWEFVGLIATRRVIAAVWVGQEARLAWRARRRAPNQEASFPSLRDPTPN